MATSSLDYRKACLPFSHLLGKVQQRRYETDAEKIDRTRTQQQEMLQEMKTIEEKIGKMQMEVEEKMRKASIAEILSVTEIYCSLPRRFNKGDVFTLADKFCQQYIPGLLGNSPYTVGKQSPVAGIH